MYWQYSTTLRAISDSRVLQAEPVLPPIRRIGTRIKVAMRTGYAVMRPVADMTHNSHVATAAMFLETDVTNSILDRMSEVPSTHLYEIMFNQPQCHTSKYFVTRASHGTLTFSQF